MALMTLMPYLGPTPMGPETLFKLSPGHSLLAWPILEQCWSAVEPQPGPCLALKPIELDLNLWISFLAWFLLRWTCLMITGPYPIPDLLIDFPARPQTSHHHYTAFCCEFLVGPGHHFWVCPAHLSLALWDWDLAGKAPAWLMAHLPWRSPALAAPWQIYPGVWMSDVLEGAAALPAGARKQHSKSEREGELSSQK